MLNSITFGELFPNFDMPGTIEPIIHKGEWAIHDVLPILLEHIGSATVKIATFSISEDSLRPLFFLVERGMISELSLMLDLTVRRNKLDMLLFAAHISPRIHLTNNHAKIILVSNDKHSFGIVGSANMNKLTRIEAGVYFTSGRFFDKYNQMFDEYFTQAIPYELEQ